MFQIEDWGFLPNQFVYQEDPFLERVINPNNLYEAYKNSIKGVTWKSSVQRYCIEYLSRINKAIELIKTGKYIPRIPYEFTLQERGHTRYIKSVYIEDRIIQRSINDNVLMPSVANFLIYDNGASQTGKGLSFARNEFKKHLINACFEFGPDEGYILLIDFSKYFDNIIHQFILDMLRGFVNDQEYALILSIFNQFKIDVSYMDDDEYASCLDNLFNSLEYSLIDKELLTGEKFMNKSVGIGNQISQITGIYYPHEIDNYIKIVKGIKYYGRYMDDSYVICRTKEECENILNDVNNIAIKYGIHINFKKTRIQKLHDNQIKYLKILYTAFSKPNGRILEIVPQETFIREYKRIHKFRELYLWNKMSLSDILQCFLSWKGSYEVYPFARPSIESIESILKLLFGIDFNIDLKLLCHQLLQKEKEIELSKISLYD